MAHLLSLFALEQTSCRPGEVAAATAAHFDYHSGTRILDEHKTARSTGVPRVVTLTPEMAALTGRLAAKRPNGPCSATRTASPGTATPSAAASSRAFAGVGRAELIRSRATSSPVVGR